MNEALSKEQRQSAIAFWPVTAGGWEATVQQALDRAEALRHALWASRCDCRRAGLQVVERCPRCAGLAADDEARQA